MDKDEGDIKMRRMIAMLFVAVLFTLMTIGCKTQSKVISNNRIETTENIKNDISEQKTDATYLEIQKAIEKAIKERLDITKVEKIYDTSKPIDFLSGKPPLLSESEIKLTKKVESLVVDTGKVKSSQLVSEISLDNSEKKTIANETVKFTSESNKVNELNVFLKWLGISAIVIVILFVGYKLFFKRNGVL